MASMINFSGIASGIDSTALINAMSQASKKQLVDPLQQDVQDLTDTNSALSELKTKFAKLQTAIKAFASISGGGLVKSTSSTNDTIVGASASNAATNGSYNITVDSLARNGSVAFSQSYSSTSAYVGSTGTVAFTVGSGSQSETVNVSVTSGSTTISDFVNSFNAQSTKAHASLVNIGTSSSPDYRMVVSSNNTGTDQGNLAIDTGTVTELAAKNLDQATNAQFDINGLTNVTRQSNSVSDVVTGLTFNLASTGTATISVGDDSTTTQSKVQNIIDAYNNIVKFVNDNNQIVRKEDGSNVQNIFQPLASTRVDDNALGTLRNVFASTNYSSGSAVKMFADLGITTERDGTLKFNPTTFQNALGAEPESVRQLLTSFADTTSVTGGTIDSFIRYGGNMDIAINSNQSTIDGLNKQITTAESSISSQEDSMRKRFSRLEALIGRMQSQQQALSSIIKSIG